MTDTLIVCATALIIVLSAIASHLYLTVSERKQRDNELLAVSRAAQVKETWLVSVDRLYASLEEFKTNRTQEASALLALSERIAIMEGAMKTAIASMVNITGWTEERHQQTVAAAVRGGKKLVVGPALKT